MTKIVDNEVYTNGKIEVKVLKHFSRWEDCIKKEMVDFVFSINAETNETIIRTKKEFCEEFRLGKLDSFEAITLEKVFEQYNDIYAVANNKKEIEKLQKEFFKNFKNEYEIIEK